MVERFTLSKSKFLAGCQCPRRLYLSCRAPELATPPGGGLQAVLDLGHEVGRRAHALFPGGVLIAEEAYEHDRAVEHTRRVLADPAVGALFEAAFVHDGVRVRVDVLERLPGGSFGLREVKASTRVKPVHLEDCAVQRFVLEGCGIPVESVELLHVDRNFVRGKGPIDWRRFFVREDVTEEVGRVPGEIRGRVAEMQAIVARDRPPSVEPSAHCFEPYDCEFWGHCTRDRPDDWVFRLPRLRDGPFDALRAEGVERIRDIPDGFPLSDTQKRIREVWRRGRPFVSPGLPAEIAGLGPPTAYLDFETMNPAIPFYPGTRPYQRIPFQWSLHRVDTSGSLHHHAFLAEGDLDPRRELAQTLLAALAPAPGEDDPTPILVYSAFESSVLGDLAAHLPDLACALQAIRERLVDLLPIVRRNLYLRDFDFSYSIKNVVPALSAGFGYDDLEGIAEGTAASSAFTSIVAGALDAGRAETLRRQLLAYCERDTLALVELHRALVSRAGSRVPARSAS
ncbi:MAG: DUF2779 domain-containing protein [Myxococcota bacterium]